MTDTTSTDNSGSYEKRRSIRGLHPNVFFLGLVSLLTDVSSEMIFTLVPLFLTNILGAAGFIVGIVGGVSEAADAIFRIASGWLSDKIGKRKLLALSGYSISTVSKPFLLLAGSWGMVLAVRFSDRIGKGVRSSSRDALVADSVSPDARGKGFGLHRAMDTTGAFLGLIVAAGIVYFVQGTGAIRLSQECFRWLVIGGIIPAVLAVIVLQVFVNEKSRKQPDKLWPHIISTEKNHFDKRFKIFLVLMAIFTLGNSSDFFIILRAQDMGSPLLQVVLMVVVHNAAYALFSLPMGMLSDRLGRKRVIALGWLIYALAYLGFAAAGSLWQIWLLFAFYGVYYGVVEGAARAFVADLVTGDRRGTAYGLYHGVIGITLLAASLLAGWLWDALSPSAPFLLGAGLAFVAMLGIMALIQE